MELDLDALREACFAAAKGAMWDVRPTDVDKIKDLGDSFLGMAMNCAGKMVEQGRDPNILVRAVSYLAHTHAIPEMHDGREWFLFMLTALVELACPSKEQTPQSAAVFTDLEEGIAQVRHEFGL